MSVDLEYAKDFIRAHAAACAPYEACGLIVRAGNKQEVICARNAAEDPRHAFLIEPEDLVAAEETGEVLALYHSHVHEAPNPSPADKTLAEREGVPVIILSHPDDQWAIYEPTGWRAALVGRPFVYGVLDCLSLVRDYFAELPEKIVIPQFDYSADWWKRGLNLFVDLLPAHGFVRVEDDLRKNDLILFALGSAVANHCAVYVGEGLILHHPPGHLSGYHPYVANGGGYSKNAVSIWRHRKLFDVAVETTTVTK